MITYYDDKSVRVTSDAFRVGGRAYPLRGLVRVWHRRGRRSWRTLAGRGALGAALIGPVVAAVLGVVVALQIDASTTATVALVGVACLGGFAAAPLADLLLERMDRSYARGSHELQIWASFRGQPVLLLHTRDALRFGQIYRALERAIESGQSTRAAAGQPSLRALDPRKPTGAAAGQPARALDPRKPTRPATGQSARRALDARR